MLEADCRPGSMGECPMCDSAARRMDDKDERRFGGRRFNVQRWTSRCDSCCSGRPLWSSDVDDREGKRQSSKTDQNEHGGWERAGDILSTATTIRATVECNVDVVVDSERSGRSIANNGLLVQCGGGKSLVHKFSPQVPKGALLTGVRLRGRRSSAEWRVGRVGTGRFQPRHKANRVLRTARVHVSTMCRITMYLGKRLDCLLFAWQISFRTFLGPKATTGTLSHQVNVQRRDTATEPVRIASLRCRGRREASSPFPRPALCLITMGIWSVNEVRHMHL
jgi:hypothetical protein